MKQEMKDILKPVAKTMILAFFVGPLISLFMTWVLRSLWNWFATDALHLPEISFWVMYGLVLIVGMFTAKVGDKEQEYHFKALATMLDACVPDDKKEWVREQLEDQYKGIWSDIGTMVFGRILDITWVLVIGWAVHRFLL